MNNDLWNASSQKGQSKLQIFGMPKESEIVPYGVRKALTSWEAHRRFLEKRKYNNWRAEKNGKRNS